MDRLKHKFLNKDLTGIKTAEGYITLSGLFVHVYAVVSGVAIGNTAARIIGFIVILIVLQNTKARLSLKNRRARDLKCLGSILKIGIPGGVANLSYSLSQIVTTSTLALVGTQALSAKIYISSIVFLCKNCEC